MSKRTFHMCERVLDKHAPIGRIVWYIANHYRRDEILNWLIKNHLTGRALQEWAIIEFGSDQFWLDPVKYILSRIDRDSTPKPIRLMDLLPGQVL